MIMRFRYVNYLIKNRPKDKEELRLRIESWDIITALKIAKDCDECKPYAFYFTYESIDSESLSNEPTLLSRSGTYYIDGQIKSLEELKNECPEERILISNMEETGHDRAVKTCVGTWDYFKKDDKIVKSINKR